MKKILLFNIKTFTLFSTFFVIPALLGSKGSPKAPEPLRLTNCTHDREEKSRHCFTPPPMTPTTELEVKRLMALRSIPPTPPRRSKRIANRDDLRQPVWVIESGQQLPSVLFLAYSVALLHLHRILKREEKEGKKLIKAKEEIVFSVLINCDPDLDAFEHLEASIAVEMEKDDDFDLVIEAYEKLCFEEYKKEYPRARRLPNGYYPFGDDAQDRTALLKRLRILAALQAVIDSDSGSSDSEDEDDGDSGPESDGDDTIAGRRARAGSFSSITDVGKLDTPQPIRYARPRTRSFNLQMNDSCRSEGEGEKGA